MTIFYASVLSAGAGAVQNWEVKSDVVNYTRLHSEGGKGYDPRLNRSHYPPRSGG